METRLNLSVIERAILSQKEISIALSAYLPNFQLVRRILSTKSPNEKLIEIELSHYPFTREPMPYASMNLINLGIEQSILVHLDYEVCIGNITGFWPTINRYRELVNSGHWLVPKLETKVIHTVPLNTILSLRTRILKSWPGNKRHIIWFSAESTNYFHSKGVAVFLDKLQ